MKARCDLQPRVVAQYLSYIEKGVADVHAKLNPYHIWVQAPPLYYISLGKASSVNREAFLN